MNEEIDIIGLAARAKLEGIDSVEGVSRYLEGMIARSNEYLAYRKQAGRRTSHDEIVERDKTVIAMAIILLESLQGNESL